VSEPQNAEKKEEKPNLEPFLGLVEHISRSMGTAERATADLPDLILTTMEVADGIDSQKRVDIAHELGRIREDLWLLHRLLIDDLAENFFNKPKNVKRYMVIMSYLAKAYWDLRDGKADNVATLEGALEEARNNLEEYLADVINSMLSDDYDDNDDSDDDSATTPVKHTPPFFLIFPFSFFLPPALPPPLPSALTSVSNCQTAQQGFLTPAGIPVSGP